MRNNVCRQNRQPKGPFYCHRRKELIYFNKIILRRSLCLEIIHRPLHSVKGNLHKRATNYVASLFIFHSGPSWNVAYLATGGISWLLNNTMIRLSPPAAERNRAKSVCLFWFLILFQQSDMLWPFIYSIKRLIGIQNYAVQSEAARSSSSGTRSSFQGSNKGNNNSKPIFLRTSTKFQSTPIVPVEYPWIY